MIRFFRNTVTGDFWTVFPSGWALVGSYLAKSGNAIANLGQLSEASPDAVAANAKHLKPMTDAQAEWH